MRWKRSRDSTSSGFNFTNLCTMKAAFTLFTLICLSFVSARAQVLTPGNQTGNPTLAPLLINQVDRTDGVIAFWSTGTPPVTSNYTYTYDPNAPSESVNFDGGGGTFNRQRNCFNTLVIEMDRVNGTSARFENVRVNGTLVANVLEPPLGSFGYWTITGIDFTQPVTVTGTLTTDVPQANDGGLYIWLVRDQGRPIINFPTIPTATDASARFCWGDTAPGADRCVSISDAPNAQEILRWRVLSAPAGSSHDDPMVEYTPGTSNNEFTISADGRTLCLEPSPFVGGFARITGTYQVEVVKRNTVTTCESTETFDMTIVPTPEAAATGKTILSGEMTLLDVLNPNNVAGSTFNWSVNYNGVTGGAGAANGVAFGANAINETLINNTCDPIDVVYTITPVGPAPDFCQGTPIMTTVTVSPFLPIEQTITNATDNNIVEGTPNQAGGAVQDITVDLLSNGAETQALLKFNGVSIPPGASLLQANLIVYTNNPTDGQISLHRMIQSWDNTTTWNTFGGNGVMPDGTEAVNTASAIRTNLADDADVAFNVTDDVQFWLDNPGTNQGWVFFTDSDNGWDFWSSEYSVQTQRPRLVLSYAAAPTIGNVTPSPSAWCVGETFDVQIDGLANMGNFGVEFVAFPGNMPPADPYDGSGTSLGIVPNANLTGTSPNQIAALANVGNNLPVGTYQVCAILQNIANTNPDCLPSRCVTVSVDPIPAAAANDRIICSGSSTAIEVTNPNGIPDATFNWTAQYNGVTGGAGATNGVAFGADAINEQLVNATNASVDVVYTITPVGGAPTFCEGTPIDVIVTVAPTPALSASITDIALCANDIVSTIGSDLTTNDVQFSLQTTPNLALASGEQLIYQVRALGQGSMIDNPNAGIAITAAPLADADGYTMTFDPGDSQIISLTDDLQITGNLSDFTQPITIQYAIFPRFRRTDGAFCDGDDIVVTVTITPPVLIDAGNPQEICSTKKLPLASLQAFITQSGQPLGGTWTIQEADSDGMFLDASEQPLADADFEQAVYFMPGDTDADRGFVTLILTSDDPAAPCSAVSDDVIITVLKVDCGSFPWRGQ